jgi:hypothetical protein
MLLIFWILQLLRNVVAAGDDEDLVRKNASQRIANAGYSQENT